MSSLHLRPALRPAADSLQLPGGRLIARPVCAPRPQKHARGRRCTEIRAALSSPALFGTATLAVLPLYALIVAAPRWQLTRRVLAPNTFFLAAAALYLSLLGAWHHLLPPAWDVVRAAVHARALPDVAAFAALFSKPGITALTWVHLLLLDLFQARSVTASWLATARRSGRQACSGRRACSPQLARATAHPLVGRAWAWWAGGGRLAGESFALRSASV